MLEKSFGLLFFLKQPKNYKKGPMYIYIKITVNGKPRRNLHKKALRDLSLEL